MKKLTAKYLSLMMLVAMLGGSAQAGHDYGYANGDCCTRQYECGCNPLYCGAWDLQVQAGVVPVLWRNRGPILGVNCQNSDVVVNLFDTTPRFRKFFKIPWTVGGQVGYAMSDNTRVYLEFNYVQANRKNDVVINSDFLSTLPITFGFGKYKVFDGYVGARYYWDRWCDRLSLFLGAKVGFTHHKRSNVDLTFAANSALTDLPYYRSSTVVSGGGNIGLDYCICGNWSLVLTGEVVASCGPRGVGLINFGDVQSGFSAIVTGSTGTELRFPITLAVRYSF